MYNENVGGDNVRIVLDDTRKFPENATYNCVRTYDECCYLLRIFRDIKFISLDYNLGTEKTGLDVLIYMHENGNNVAHINIHSDNIIGIPKMREYAETHFPKAQLTFNPI